MSERIYWRDGHRVDFTYDDEPATEVRAEHPEIWERVHVLTDTELAAEQAKGQAEERKRIASEIDRVRCDPDRVRPRVRTGEFLNDFAWAARIARQGGSDDER